MKPLEISVPLGEIIGLQMMVLDAKRAIATGNYDDSWRDLEQIFQVVQDWYKLNK